MLGDSSTSGASSGVGSTLRRWRDAWPRWTVAAREWMFRASIACTCVLCFLRVALPAEPPQNNSAGSTTVLVAGRGGVAGAPGTDVSPQDLDAVSASNATLPMMPYIQRFPPVAAGNATASTSPSVRPLEAISPAARIAALEAKVAELEQVQAGTPTSIEQLPAPESSGNAPPLPPDSYVLGNEFPMFPRWFNGFVFESPGQDFIVRVGGRLQADTGFFGQSPGLTNTPIADGGVGPNNDSTEFRRARVRIDGVMYRFIGWAAEVDFATMANARNILGNPPGFPSNVQGPPNQGPLVVSPSITDMFVTITEMPIGNFRAGNFKEPLGLEHLTSDRWLDFMERSYNMDAFYGPFNNGFSPGIMLFDWTEDLRSTWALWCGPNNSNPFAYHIGNQFAGTVRGTYLPYYDEISQGRYLIHLGTSGSIRRPDQNQDELFTRGNIRSGPPSTANPLYADTGSFATSCQEMVNLEVLGIWGPWTFQSEYLATFLQNARQNPFNSALPPAQINLPPAGSPGNSVFFQGTYVEALYFLTGESRPYDRREGLPMRIVPNRNFYMNHANGGNPVGWGALQVGARYSYLDLNSNGINGGQLNSFTLGINWFLNPNMKFQFNYDYTARGAVAAAAAGTINSGGMRLALDF
jgi:phosphate-selective porin OprO/OprP